MHIYDDLLKSIELIKQYLLEHGESYSMQNMNSFDIVFANSIFFQLENIKRGLNGCFDSTSKTEEFVSDFLSIKYNPQYIEIVKSVRKENNNRCLRKVSSR